MERFKGKIITKIEGMKTSSYYITFHFNDGSYARMFHITDCCESVSLNEIIGDIKDIINTPIIEAEEVSSESFPPPEFCESYTWTFYKFRTIKGDLTLRWLGESNGYYSEVVHLEFDPEFEEVE